MFCVERRRNIIALQTVNVLVNPIYFWYQFCCLFWWTIKTISKSMWNYRCLPKMDRHKNIDNTLLNKRRPRLLHTSENCVENHQTIFITKCIEISSENCIPNISLYFSLIYEPNKQIPELETEFSPRDLSFRLMIPCPVMNTQCTS